MALEAMGTLNKPFETAFPSEAYGRCGTSLRANLQGRVEWTITHLYSEPFRLCSLYSVFSQYSRANSYHDRTHHLE